MTGLYECGGLAVRGRQRLADRGVQDAEAGAAFGGDVADGGDVFGEDLADG